jgi:hypothetical protein
MKPVDPTFYAGRKMIPANPEQVKLWCAIRP